VIRAFTEPPVEPDADTARQWAADELSKSEYHTGPSLVERLLRWIASQLNHLNDVPVGVGPGPIIVIVVVAAAVVALSFVVAGPVRRSGAIRRQAGEVLADDSRTAEQIRAAAAAAAAAGDLTLATAEWFRALVRGMEERTLIDERPGRTADEAADAAGVCLPDLADQLGQAATAFDQVVYGRRRASADDEARLRALEDRVRHTRADRAAEVV